MTSDRIKERLKAVPFRAFRLHLGSGRALDVDHPEFFSLSPSGRTAVVYGPNDELEIIDVLMVQSLELLPGGKRSNGRRKSA